jgi:hypothetical protein
MADRATDRSGSSQATARKIGKPSLALIRTIRDFATTNDQMAKGVRFLWALEGTRSIKRLLCLIFCLAGIVMVPLWVQRLKWLQTQYIMAAYRMAAPLRLAGSCLPSSWRGCLHPALAAGRPYAGRPRFGEAITSIG